LFLISNLLTRADFFQALSEPIDVYCEWVDACEAVAKNEEGAGKSAGDDKARDDYEDDTRPASKGVLSDSEDGF